MNDLAQQKKFHYGWVIVIGGFLSQIVLMCGVQLVPLLMPYLKESLQLTTTQAGTIMSVFGLFYAGCSFIWGFCADRFGARVAVTLSGLVLGVFVLLFGLIVQSYTTALFIYAIVGFGAAGVYSATIPKLIGAWFAPRKRGRAMSLITPGGVLTGACLGLLMPVLANNYGWQSTSVILGVVAVVCTLLVLLVVKNKPSEKGLEPVGADPAESAQELAKVEEKGSLGKVLKMGKTWHVSLMYIFWQVGFMTGTSFVALSFTDAGFTTVQGGLAVTTYNLCQLIGQQIWGPLSDRIERKFVIAIACLFWAIATFGYIALYGGSMATMYVMIGIMGVGMGSVPVILASFSDYYPPELRGSGAGTISTMGLVGRFFGPMLAGVVADATGVITGAFGFGAIAMIVAAAIAFTLPNLRTKSAIKASA